MIKTRRTDLGVRNLDELLGHIGESIGGIMLDPQTAIDNHVYASFSMYGDLRSYSLEDIENSLGLHKDK
jgi:hypothetical protein